MSILIVYARIYASCVARAVQAIGRSPWTLLLPVVVWFLAGIVPQLMPGFGPLGGIVAALGLAAIFASYLYVVGELVSDARVKPAELASSFGPYFWAILNVGFVIWIAEWLIGMGLARNPKAGVIFLLVHLGEFVLFNATPECIYLRGTLGGLATVQRSLEFVQASWIEWFAPNLLLGALFFYGPGLLARLGVPLAVTAVLAGALFHLAMVFRGFLFKELDGSSHRQRMFRHRTGS